MKLQSCVMAILYSREVRETCSRIAHTTIPPDIPVLAAYEEMTHRPILLPMLSAQSHPGPQTIRTWTARKRPSIYVRTLYHIYISTSRDARLITPLFEIIWDASIMLRARIFSLVPNTFTATFIYLYIISMIKIPTLPLT